MERLNAGATVSYVGGHFQIFVFGINGFPDSFGHVLKPVRLKHFVFMKCRYILDAGRRSSSTKDRTRYRYMLPHFNTLQILNNEFNHVM
ncbi:hypothetical protein HanRHA438_Chr09g0389711 [Helianthus annuus]|nr:hypothetical protein HanRHA438_Chr09g0389711 [Helianthus annuus]